MVKERMASLGFRISTRVGIRHRAARITCAGTWRPWAMRTFSLCALLKATLANELPDLGNPSMTSCVSGVTTRARSFRSEEHTSELQSRQYLVCRLLLEKKKKEKD